MPAIAFLLLLSSVFRDDCFRVCSIFIHVSKFISLVAQIFICFNLFYSFSVASIGYYDARGIFDEISFFSEIPENLLFLDFSEITYMRYKKIFSTLMLECDWRQKTRCKPENRWFYHKGD